LIDPKGAGRGAACGARIRLLQSRCQKLFYRFYNLFHHPQQNLALFSGSAPHACRKKGTTAPGATHASPAFNLSVEASDSWKFSAIISATDRKLREAPMKKSHYSLIMMILLSLSSFSINAVDSKEEVREDAQSHKYGTRQQIRFVAPVDADGVQRVEMIAGEYFFSPNFIVVKVNKPVELKIKKTGGYIYHNLIAKAPEAGIDFTIELKNNEPQSIRFTPTKTGKYPFYCDKKMFWFRSHRGKGMEGLIEVVD
jgi:plastocyanin